MTCFLAALVAVSWQLALSFRSLPVNSRRLQRHDYLRSLDRNADIFTLSSAVDAEDLSLTNVEDFPQQEHWFDWERQWYPLAVDEFTDRGKPHNLQILGKDLVLWHDGGQWRAFEDKCPHRGVRLSKSSLLDLRISLLF